MLIRPMEKNVVVRRFIQVLCRFVGNEHDRTLEADLKHVEEEVRRCVDEEIVDAIKEIVEKLMMSVALERYADRKAPWVLVHRALTWPKSQAHQLKQEAVELKEQRLKPLVGDRTHAIWKVCDFSAWGEQNTRDWDGAQGGTITGTAWGYLEMSKQNLEIVEKFWDKMGFDG
mmetsp:Transcript_59021/g.118052  ORF Transcript_59021/g.118052 Transcript_59021/m.118052 type:complete len:172 (+) Transcript_59021:104-619(+)